MTIHLPSTTINNAEVEDVEQDVYISQNAFKHAGLADGVYIELSTFLSPPQSPAHQGHQSAHISTSISAQNSD